MRARRITVALLLIILGLGGSPLLPSGSRSPLHPSAASDLAGSALNAQGEILLPRHPAPSPDGTQIAFGYQGDIWVVASTGGEARRLTAHPGYDYRPVWSPDGNWIAFTSLRDGSGDVYALPVDGGLVRQLTWHSDSDLATDWTPDGQGVLFQSRRHIRDGDGRWGMFVVPLAGGQPLAILPTVARMGVLSPDGSRLAYMRGSVYWWRRGYEGNARYRLWLHELDPPLRADVDGWPWKEWGALPRPELGAGGDGLIRGVATSAGLLAGATLRPTGTYTPLSEPGPAAAGAWYDDPGRIWLENWNRGVDLSHPEIETGSNAYPQWLPDGDHLLYISESGGVANLKLLSISGGGRAWVTRFTEGRLRFAKVSRNGRLVAFEYEDGIYTAALPAQLPPADSSEWPEPPPEPQRLRIRTPLDERAATVERAAVNSEASEMAVSPDGEQVAFVHRGDVFVMKTSKEEPAAYPVTSDPGRDYQVAWMPDSKALIFVSDRKGSRDLYRVASADSAEARLARTLHHELTQLTRDSGEEWGPKPSPDGQRIAYLRDGGTLMVMNADGSDPLVLLENSLDIEFEWSPDSRWLMYSVEDDDFNADIWIVSADGEIGPHNISQHPDDDYGAVWSPDGRMVAFVSSRAFINEVDIWYVWLTREEEEKAREDRLEEYAEGWAPHGRHMEEDASGGAHPRGETDPWEEDDEDADEQNGDEEDADEEEKAVEVLIDFEDIHERLHRVTTFPGHESRVLVSKDCSEFVFVSDTDGRSDLWKVKWDGSEPSRLTSGGQSPRQLQWGPKGKTIFYLKEGGRIGSVKLSGGDVTTYPFESEMRVDLLAERAAAFDEAWRRLNDGFYDGNHHGCDWPAMREHYRSWALAASTPQDYHDVVRMMMGEINASHLGIWGGPADSRPELRDALEGGSTPDARSGLPAQTGDLGVLFDPSYAGPGLRILHVFKGTPAERVDSRLEPGEILLSIAGEPVDLQTNVARLLNRTVDRKLSLEVRDREGETREVVIAPTSAGGVRWEIYEQEIAARRARVREQSDDRVAYVHIESMDTSSLDRFERDLYAQAHGKEALIIDVRNNGGGWTTDLMLTSLLAGDHAITVARGAGPGYPEDRRLLYAWTEPVVVLCNEHSFSNAEIFSWAIRALGRGPVVGQRTHGGVISTGGSHLVDGSWLRMPFRGWWSKLDGSPLEGSGCVPDHPVRNAPGEYTQGIDRQLEKAIELAREQID